MPRQHQQYSVDGFTLRRRSSPNVSNESKSGLTKPAVPGQFLRPTTAGLTRHGESAPDTLPRPQLTTPKEEVGSGLQASSEKGALRRSDIDQSLRDVDTEPQKDTKRGKKKFRRARVKKRWIALGIGLILLAVAGYFVVKFILASSNIFSGNVFDLLGSGAQLKQDSNGRTNILVFGTSEDDAGHAGAELTDSIMVLSLDQTKKTAAMVSMPRDLWVDYGKACASGYSGKINVVYMCGATNGDVTAGAQALQEKVGEVFGLDVQYFAKVNYTVVRELTTALGGVTVTVESSDSRGIYDVNTKLRLPNGPATLQGEQALAFVRARGDGGGYGFEGSNFAREKNQQKMIVAIRDKALSLGTLSNPVAVNGMLDALGNNITTSFSAAEIKTLTKLAQDISSDKVTSISLVDKDNPVVTTGSYNGQSIVRPIAGLTDYSKVAAYIAQKMNGDVFNGESPTVEILNASNTAGVAAKKQTLLANAGFSDITIGDSTRTITSSVVWYDMTQGAKPKSQAKLASLLGKQPDGTTLPGDIHSTADFVVLLGDE